MAVSAKRWDRISISANRIRDSLSWRLSGRARPGIEQTGPPRGEGWRGNLPKGLGV